MTNAMDEMSRIGCVGPVYGGTVTDVSKLKYGTEFFVTNGIWHGRTVLSDGRPAIYVIEKKSTVVCREDMPETNILCVAEVRYNGQRPAHTGFYLYDDYESVLENVPLKTPVKNARTLQDFLHGQCVAFALALQEVFPDYELEFLSDPEEYRPHKSAVTSLLHMYCVDRAADHYIDVRGVTEEITECFEPFEDFFTEPLCLRVDRNTAMSWLTSVMDAQTVMETIDAARTVIHDRKHLYGPKKPY